MPPLAALLRRPAADPRRDGELLAAFLRDRDEPAFAELVRRHGPLVWGACRRSLPDAADAEDAFQATFLVLVRRAGRLTGAATVGPWLHAVARHVVRNARRKNARRLARTAALPDVPDPRPAPEPGGDLDAALGALPARFRTAVLLTYLEGLTHREAADRLGCAEGTVSSLVSRGLARLRAKFDPAALLVAVPAGVEAAAVRTAGAATLAAAPSGVAALTTEVLRMFWVRKATAAGAATLVLLVLGFAAGLSVRQRPDAGAQEKEKGAVTQPEAPAKAGEPYTVFTVRGVEATGLRRPTPEPFTITEYDAKGTCLWSVVPGRDQAEKWSTSVKLIDLDHAAIVAGAREYLTRQRKDVDRLRELRVVIENDAQVGGFTAEALKICLDAGFDTIKLTGYLPNGGGFIPQLKIGPDGEATGYKRYRGERLETKKLVADYGKMLRTF